ncbi:energy-coupled thiamine transporter ThiT [Vagococcus entomophilus]|uniref:Energy-coupled thiamine transporter ThiT n=1 Tax=Vagococcus entomophilus TaxID=1160095 RepID=A0A430AHP1_9ENTE|nr:energy-coupled thiamine transporter ThiT [Vagococcus entomophilus]RSU07408.1 energy-coupled thiamine transporter ThiT [Vagococcus entomophilus]
MRLNVWIEGTIVAALAMAFSFIPTTIGSSFSISLGCIPLTVYAFRRGVKPTLFSGLVWGLLHFLTGQVYYLSVSQVLIEYLIAFTCIGFAGVVSEKLQVALAQNNGHQVTKLIIQGTFSGILARYFWHFVAGVIFWGSYALWGMNPWIFSLVMNGASGLATGVVTLIVVLVISKKWPQLLRPSK